MLGPVIKLIKFLLSSSWQSFGINDASPLWFTLFSTIGCLPFIILSSFLFEISGFIQFSSLEIIPKLKKKSNSPIESADILISDLNSKIRFFNSEKILNSNSSILKVAEFISFSKDISSLFVNRTVFAVVCL